MKNGHSWMLLLHTGIPPSGHGYTPPIAVAIITGLAKKGLSSAELHLRVYYSSAPLLSTELSSDDKKQLPSASRAKETRCLSRVLQRNRLSFSRRRNGTATMELRLYPFFFLYSLSCSWRCFPLYRKSVLLSLPTVRSIRQGMSSFEYPASRMKFSTFPY